MAKPKRRGKAKTRPIEAARLAFVVRRVQRGDAVFIAAGDKLVPGKAWAEQVFWKTAGAESATLTDAAKELRRIKRSDSEALRTLADKWRLWDSKRLKWRSRALTMAELGFLDFKDMSRSTFDRWCERAAKLYPDRVSQL